MEELTWDQSRLTTWGSAVHRLISALLCLLCSQSHQDKAVISQFACWLYAAVKHLDHGRLFALLHCTAAWLKLPELCCVRGELPGKTACCVEKVYGLWSASSWPCPLSWLVTIEKADVGAWAWPALVQHPITWYCPSFSVTVCFYTLCAWSIIT